AGTKPAPQGTEGAGERVPGGQPPATGTPPWLNSARGLGAELVPHLCREGLAVGVAVPGVALEAVEAFAQVEEGPLGGAVQVVQFVAGDGYRHGQARAGAHGVGAHGAGAAVVAQVVDEDLADAVLWAGG